MTIVEELKALALRPKMPRRKVQQRFTLELVFAKEPFTKDCSRRKSTYRRRCYHFVTMAAADKIVAQSPALGYSLFPCP